MELELLPPAQCVGKHFLVCKSTWLSIAAAGGYDKANQNLNIVAEELTPEELSQAQQRATELFEKIESGKK